MEVNDMEEEGGTEKVKGENEMCEYEDKKGRKLIQIKGVEGGEEPM